MINTRQASTERNNTHRVPALSWRDPLHIAVVVEDLRPPFDEGIKKTSFSLICSFIRREANVSVFTRYGNPSLSNVFPLPANKFLLGHSFSRSLRAQKPDVIFYSPTSSGTVGAFVRAAAIKTQSSSTPLALLNLQYRKLPVYARYLNLCRYTDIVFTQSQSSTDVFRSLGCKTILLPGGVDHTIFRPPDEQEKHLLRLKHGFQDIDKIVLHIGHCHRGRSVTALAHLAMSGFKVILITSTSTVIDRDLLVELRMSGVTVITDFVANIQHFYQMADCYLFPVLHSVSAIDAPLSVLEAMACNLPVVTTRFGALPDVFQCGDGFYYMDNEEELVNIVDRAVQEKDCKTSEKVARYSWDNVTSLILETLEEVSNR